MKIVFGLPSFVDNWSDFQELLILETYIYILLLLRYFSYKVLQGIVAAWAKFMFGFRLVGHK